MKVRVAFKNQGRSTGLAAIANPHPHIDVRFNAKNCGLLIPPSHMATECQWKFQLALQAPGEATFKWTCFKVRFDDSDKAKEWIRANADAIVAKFPNIYYFPQETS